MTILVWIISLASIVLMLLRPRGIAEVYWICGGAAVLAASGLLPFGRVIFALREGINIYLFLAGMMVLAELAREEGVFLWVSELALRRSGATQFGLFVLVYVSGIAITAFLSNDATAVVLTPAVLAIVRRARVDARPYIFACALVANSASFLLPISNPANLIVFRRRVPPLAQWLQGFWLPSVVALTVTFACLWAIHHRSLRGGLAAEGSHGALPFEGRLTLVGLIGAAAVLITASAFGLPLGPPACAAAILALAAVAWKDRQGPRRALLGASWAVLPLVGGLFVIVEALQGAGLLHLGRLGLQWLSHAPHPMGEVTAGFTAALLSNVLNNLPIGLAGAAMIQNAQGWHSPAQHLLSHAILLGVDLGPNLSVSGSLATILWLMALRREGVPMTAWEFLKVGALTMPLALAASLLMLAK